MTKRLLTWEAKNLKQYGWYAHTLIGDEQSPTGLNYHTHGFGRLGHLDLQLVFPSIQNKARHAIAAAIFEQIKEGCSFGDGDRTDIPGQSGKFQVHFIKVREDDRDVLRVILPTRDGQLEPAEVADDSDPFYSLQWTVTAV